MKAKKCKTERYRRQRAREKIAHVKHVARRQQEERERRAWLEAAAERRRQEWLADPRRAQIQELVNVLAARLYSHPLYKPMALFRTITSLNWQ
jgi:adenosyl cobinamide kinase/adenosyl cobinamide phosphate guanylyltransferase